MSASSGKIAETKILLEPYVFDFTQKWVNDRWVPRFERGQSRGVFVTLVFTIPNGGIVDWDFEASRVPPYAFTPALNAPAAEVALQQMSENDIEDGVAATFQFLICWPGKTKPSRYFVKFAFDQTSLTRQQNYVSPDDLARAHAEFQRVGPYVQGFVSKLAGKAIRAEFIAVDVGPNYNALRVKCGSSDQWDHIERKLANLRRAGRNSTMVNGSTPTDPPAEVHPEGDIDDPKDRVIAFLFVLGPSTLYEQYHVHFLMKRKKRGESSSSASASSSKDYRGGHAHQPAQGSPLRHVFEVGRRDRRASKPKTFQSW